MASSTVSVSVPRSTRLASLMLQTGLVVCVLAVVPLAGGGWLYVDPKELVVDLVGLITASLCLISVRRLAIDRTDLFLGLFLVVSIVSASFAATDRWVALRTVGLTISGAAVFWSSRYLARQGQRRSLLDAVAIALVLVSVTVVIDAFGYGLAFPHASSNGTLGNRNWAAQLLALGMPLLALQSLAGQTTKRRALGLCALMVSTVALVLTRSRTGWIAATLGTAFPLVLLAANSRLSRSSASTARCCVALGALLTGALLAVFLPTKLWWSSSNPYLESAKGIAAYDRGSGLFRLDQYHRSLAMAADHLALGVGPGNWIIVYPAYLPKKSPPGVWYPQPANSDWITLAAERGTPATILFFAFFVSLAVACWRSFIRLRRTRSCSERSLEPLFAIAILTALAVVGSLDAALQLPAPTCVFFLAVGALAPRQEVIASLCLSRGRRTLGILMILLVAATLGLFILDEMYADFLIARARGNDLQVASRIAVDADWFYNESNQASWFQEKPEMIEDLSKELSYLSPEVLSSHVVFSRGCSKIIYSSNRNGLIRPFVVDMTNPAQPTVSAIEINESRDFVAQSLAPDCRTLAMVSDRDGNGSFEIYLYDLRQRTLKNITSRPDLDEGKPVFAPHGPILAYLSDSHLSLYDYAKSAHLEVASTPETFNSVTWSESGASLYLEDERTNIWQYDLQPRQFRKIWNAPRISYSPRAISQRGKHLLFASDHESDYSQIYQLDLEGGSLTRLYNSSNDQHSPVELDPGHYTFRSTVDASFIAAELRNGKYRPLSPPVGVCYDFSLEFGAPLLFYSNDRLPISLYWDNEGKLTPLLPVSHRSRQPDAIPIKNASGMTNLLYLPSKAPSAWLIWLHGGPNEQVSPRFNLYFEFLTRRNIAVYAVNYFGSTGIGNAYALSGKSEQEMIPVQLAGIEQDIEQLRHLHPEVSSFMLVGVSYGSILAHLLVAKHPEVTRFVDFSGIADSNWITSVGSNNRFYSPMLVIYAKNDFALQNPARLDLISRYAERASVSRLVLPNEGHYIQRRGDIDLILQRLGAFLAAPVAPIEAAGGAIRQHP